MEQFPFIEFRAFSGQRLACIKGRLPVWEVIMIAQDYNLDADKVAAHLQLHKDYATPAAEAWVISGPTAFNPSSKPSPL